MAHPSELRPSAALVAYSESLIEGRRVLVFGDATSGLADALLERGARLVHLCDPDPARAVEAAVHNRSRNVFLGPLNQSALEQRDGSFDFGIIDNLGALGDLATVLRRLARALTPRGAAIIAAANAEASLRLLPERDTRATALDYYKVYDAVALEFPHLRMLGLAPFVGYALADFGLDSDPEPAIDTDYIPRGAEEPEWFVALASRLPLRLEPYALIQLPMKRALESWRSVDSSASSTQENGELGALKKELRRLRTWIDELESRAATADQRADDTQSQLEQAEMELESLRAQPNPTVADVTPAASASDELVQQMSAQIEQLTLENQKLSQAVAQGAERISELAAVEDTDQARELEQLEKQLFERGEHVRKLERELMQAESVGKELILELESRRAAEPRADGESGLGTSVELGSTENGEQRNRLEKLAGKSAVEQADLEAAGWTIEVLRMRLEEAEAGRLRAEELEIRLTQAQDELAQELVLLHQLKASSEAEAR